jgi:hypothetical protein
MSRPRGQMDPDGFMEAKRLRRLEKRLEEEQRRRRERETMDRSLPANEAVRRSAVALAKRGFHIAPLACGSKVPSRGENLLALATNDPHAVRAMFWERYTANIAILCGPSQIVIIDLDWPKGPVPGFEHIPTMSCPMVGHYEGSGLEAWDKAIAAHEALGEPTPPTYTVITRSGGRQLYFQAVPGVAHVSGAGHTPLGVGVDVRAGNTYAVGAKSIYDGKVMPRSGGIFRDPPEGIYEWDGVTEVIAPMPPWLERLLPTKRDVTRWTTTASGITVPAGTPKRVGLKYVATAIDGEISRMAGAVCGERNDTLFRTARKLGKIVAVRGIPFDPEQVVAALADAAYSTGLDDPEVASTLQRGITAGMQTPRNWRVCS